MNYSCLLLICFLWMTSTEAQPSLQSERYPEVLAIQSIPSVSQAVDWTRLGSSQRTIGFPASSKTNISTPVLPPTPSIYCYDDLAFFCKIEVKLEKAAKMPVKFRLGDVQYVDRLEGKRTY